MTWLLLFALLAGLDNVQAASGIGMLPMAVRRKLNLILAFALCESLMLMLGMWIGDRFLGLPWWQPYAELSKALLLFLCGITLIVLSQSKEDTAGIFERPAISMWIPLALSFDNLFAGIGLSAMAAPSLSLALIYSLLVLLLCLLGLLLGAKLRRWLQTYTPDHADWLSGAYLMVLAGLSIGTP